MAAAPISELVTELQTEYDRSRAFLSALEQSLKESRVDDHRRDATADGSELGDAAETEAPTTCIATAPPKKSSSLLRGKLARFFSRKESKSTCSSKAVVVDPTAENGVNVSRVQSLRRASIVALGDHLEDSCVASGGQSPMAKRSQSFVMRPGNAALAALPPAPQSAAMLRATSFRAAPTAISSASLYNLDSTLVPSYPAAATVAVSASQLPLPAVDFRRASFSMARSGGAAGATGGLPGLGQSSRRRRSSVEAMLGQAPLPIGGSFSGGGSRASVEPPYAVASGAATSVPSVTSGTGATGAGVTGNVSGSGTSGASLFKKLQQLNLPIGEYGAPELLSPAASPRGTLAGGTLFPPGGAAAYASTSQRAQSMQHSPSFRRRSVTSNTSSAQHMFVDGATHVTSGAMQPPPASVDCGADSVPLAPVGTGGGSSSGGSSAHRSSLQMPPLAAPSLSALRSQSFRHGGVGGGSVSHTSTGPGCGAGAMTAAAITNEHADLAPEDDDDAFNSELGGVEDAVPARRVASTGPMPGGVATSLLTSLLRRADLVTAASASPTGGSGSATPNGASGHGMFVGAVDAVDVVASGVSDGDALLSPFLGGAGGAAGSRHASGAAAFVPVGALCGSPSSRRLTATQLTPPLLVSPVGHRAATLLQSHNSFGHALSPTPPPAGPLAPQPPHGVLGAAATVDGSQSPAAGGAAASPSYLSQHRRMSFRASSSTTTCGAPGSSAAVFI